MRFVYVTEPCTEIRSAGHISMKLAAITTKRQQGDTAPIDGEGILHIDNFQPIGYRARCKITIDPAEPFVDISPDLGDPCDFQDDTLVYFLLLTIRMTPSL
jgi:hypothetical protein